MFPIAQAHVQNVLLVSDEAIQAGPEGLWKALRVVAEPGGAAAFAALLSRRYRPSQESGRRSGLRGQHHGGDLVGLWVTWLVWVGHSLRLRSGQALSDAFDFDLGMQSLRIASNINPNSNPKSNASDSACPERSRRECPTHTWLPTDLNARSQPRWQCGTTSRWWPSP